MVGEADLAVLLRSMEPELQGVAYGYAVTDLPVPAEFARIAEPEGMTCLLYTSRCV